MSEKKDIEQLDEIRILYKIDSRKKEIKLFDKYFIENNKDLCYIIIEEKNNDLKEYL